MLRIFEGTFSLDTIHVRYMLWNAVVYVGVFSKVPRMSSLWYPAALERIYVILSSINPQGVAFSEPVSPCSVLGKKSVACII